ncbi:MAG: hypothetical protein LBR26_04955 [Prevotella sp.]|jgi:hypothetical protein|nr:hypothetical protein [Prevotella sp.]
MNKAIAIAGAVLRKIFAHFFLPGIFSLSRERSNAGGHQAKAESLNLTGCIPTRSKERWRMFLSTGRYIPNVM